MAKFWIDYSSSVLIEAETAKEAVKLFWDSDYNELGWGVIKIDGIEEEED